jgi:hypothetical protein
VKRHEGFFLSVGWLIERGMKSVGHKRFLSSFRTPPQKETGQSNPFYKTTE